MDIRTKLHISSLKDIVLTVIGAVLCGLGCGFENFASLGMDAVGTFFDGVRTALKLPLDSIGTVSFLINLALIVFLLFAARKYVSIGTVIYMVIYGIFANLGTVILEKIISSDSIVLRSLIAVSGFVLLTFGLGIYIAVDIGVDAFTGLTLWLTDLTHKDMKYIKIALDLLLMITGIIMGARIGTFTVISVLAGGPVIEFFTLKIQKIYIRGLISRR